jgi:recombination protein RecT
MTVIQSALKAATFDLPIDQNLGYAYIVPFKNSKKTPEGEWVKKTEASFILGWKGMHQLALRTGAYKTINVIDVREGELRSYNRLTEEFDISFIEDEAERQAAEIVGYIGYYRLVNGAEKTIYMTKAQIEAHEQKFRKGQYMGKGWRDDWDAMARKTIYRVLIGKWGVMSIEYQDSKAGSALADQIKAEESAETVPTTVYEEEAPDVSEYDSEDPRPEIPNEEQTFEGAPF